MPELKEVFEMVTKQTEPDLGSWNDQERRQRRSVRNRKIGAFAIVAAVVVVAAILASTLPGGDRTTDVGRNPTTTAPEASGPVGTVTFDGTTCSMETTTDPIEPGAAEFEVVNASDQRLMVDSWQLLDGYTFQDFERAVERVGRLAEAGKRYPTPGFFPDQETEVRYLQSDVIPAHSSEVIVTTLSSGPHAIACLRRSEGAHRSLRGFQPFALVGPIDVV